jgi:hypothetical protein
MRGSDEEEEDDGDDESLISEEVGIRSSSLTEASKASNSDRMMSS